MSSVRQALLDAAYDTAVTTGWQRARMADVAAAAGVSRQTLYDQFGGRDELAQALALRETTCFLDGVEAAMGDRAGDLRDALEAAVAYALTAADDNPLVRSILTEDGGLLPYVTTRAEPLLATAKARLVEYVTAHWPVDATTADEVGEVAVRLTLSYLVLPGPASHADAAARIAAVATHTLERV